MALLILGAISSLTIISVWLRKVLARVELVVVVAADVLVITKTMATNKIFVSSISEETKEKDKQFAILFQEYLILNMKCGHLFSIW